MSILELFVLFLIVMITIWSLYYIFSNLDSNTIKRREQFIRNFTYYATVLEYHMEKAYEIIHKDRILTYSLEATKLPDSEFNEVTHQFARLTTKMLGPTLYKEFVELYGNDSTLFFTMVEYFNSKYEDDAVRQSSLDVLTNESEQEIDNGPSY